MNAENHTHYSLIMFLASLVWVQLYYFLKTFLNLPSQLSVGFSLSAASRGRKKRARAMQGEALLSSPGPSWVCSQVFSVETSVPKCRQCHLLEPVLLRNQCLWGETATMHAGVLYPSESLSLNKGPWSQYYWSKYINLAHAYCQLSMITVATLIHIQDHISSYMFSHIDQNRILSSFSILPVWLVTHSI